MNSAQYSEPSLEFIIRGYGKYSAHHPIRSNQAAELLQSFLGRLVEEVVQSRIGEYDRSSENVHAIYRCKVTLILD